MPGHQDLLRQLLESPCVTQEFLDWIPKERARTVLWLNSTPRVCLKIGIATPRWQEGLRGRIRTHFRSDLQNTVLARHLAADTNSKWAEGWDFTDRHQRQQFLASKCYFQVLPLPKMDETDLRQSERFIQLELLPRYAGRVGREMD